MLSPCIETSTPRLPRDETPSQEEVTALRIRGRLIRFDDVGAMIVKEPETPRPPRGRNHRCHPAHVRRTVATAINEQAGVDLAAELLGHTDPRITRSTPSLHPANVRPRFILASTGVYLRLRS